MKSKLATIRITAEHIKPDDGTDGEDGEAGGAYDGHGGHGGHGGQSELESV